MSAGGDHADDVRSAAVALALLPLLGLLACVPEVGPPPSRLLAPRVVAVTADPPEVAPGESVRLRLWVAKPDGPATDAELADARWHFCTAPTPPTEDNSVSARCLVDPAALLPIADTGPEVVAEVPAEACAWFGPQAPPVGIDDPPARPRDADVTGGYYQPLRIVTAAVARPTVAAVRIDCGLATAPPEIAADFRRRYRRNRPPPPPQIVLTDAEQPLPADALRTGQSLRLSVRVPTIAAEDYLRFDPASQTLALTRETLRVSWFTAPGMLVHSVTPLDDLGTGEWAADNLLELPSQPGPLVLWGVLRDSRGAASVRSSVLPVR